MRKVIYLLLFINPIYGMYPRYGMHRPSSTGFSRSLLAALFEGLQAPRERLGIHYQEPRPSDWRFHGTREQVVERAKREYNVCREFPSIFGDLRGRDRVTCYDVLGVAPTASSSEIHRAAKRLMGETHSDKVGGLDRGLTPAFEAVKEAWQEAKELQKGAAFCFKKQNIYRADHHEIFPSLFRRRYHEGIKEVESVDIPRATVETFYTEAEKRSVDEMQDLEKEVAGLKAQEKCLADQMESYDDKKKQLQRFNTNMVIYPFASWLGGMILLPIGLALSKNKRVTGSVRKIGEKMGSPSFCFRSRGSFFLLGERIWPSGQRGGCNKRAKRCA